jgi:hypothetical protein
MALTKLSLAHPRIEVFKSFNRFTQIFVPGQTVKKDMYTEPVIIDAVTQSSPSRKRIRSLDVVRAMITTGHISDATNNPATWHRFSGNHRNPAEDSTDCVLLGRNLG